MYWRIALVYLLVDFISGILFHKSHLQNRTERDWNQYVKYMKVAFTEGAITFNKLNFKHKI